MNAEQMKMTKHVTLGEFADRIGTTEDTISSWTTSNHDKLLRLGVIIEEPNKRRMYSIAIECEYWRNYDKGISVSEQLNDAVDNLVVDSDHPDDSVEVAGVDEFSFCGSICNSNAIKQIKQIDYHLNLFKSGINNLVVDHLCKDVRSILFRMTSIALREIEETYKREKGE